MRVRYSILEAPVIVDLLDPGDMTFSCQVDNIGAPYSVWIPNKGKDVTFIVYGDEIE